MTMLKNVGPGSREDYEIDFRHFEIKVTLGNPNEALWVYSSELEGTFKNH